MYDDSHYDGTHPPLIGFALDGYDIFGRYINESDEGAAVALDTCGGHTHGDFSYHYHSEARENPTFAVPAAVRLNVSVFCTARRSAGHGG